MTGLNPGMRERPALAGLIAAMAKLSRRQRLEVARIGRRAKAAKAPRIRRLTRAVTAETSGWRQRLAGDVPTYPDKVRAAERAEARKRRQRRRFAGSALITFRMAELFDYFNWLYGKPPLPNDDAGRDDLKLVFQVLSTTHDAPGRMVSVARTWAPWLPADELAALVVDIVAHPRRFKADTIAARLGITTQIRALLKLRTIGAIDKPAEQRAAERREAQRLAKEQKRRAAGVPTLAEARAMRAKKSPWIEAGLTRSTWYRRQRAA